jgi:hypothetical protein
MLAQSDPIKRRTLYGLGLIGLDLLGLDLFGLGLIGLGLLGLGLLGFGLLGLDVWEVIIFVAKPFGSERGAGDQQRRSDSLRVAKWQLEASHLDAEQGFTTFRGSQNDPCRSL